MRAFVITALAATACGRIGFDSTSATGDASRDGSNDAPGAIDARIGMGPFSPPVAVFALNSTAHDGDPTLREDLLEIVFTSDRTGGMGNRDLWSTRRATSVAPWDVPTPLVGLNSPSSDDGAELSADGLTLMFSSSRTPTLGGPDIWMATRSTLADGWGSPVPVPELSSTASEFICGMTADGLTIYLDSNRGGSLDLYVATRATPTGTWSTPVGVSALNTASSEAASHVVPDDRTVVFTSNRVGTMGGDDLWIASRTSSALPFAAVMNLSELNSIDEDTDPWLSADLTTVYFTSRRTGNSEMFAATR